MLDVIFGDNSYGIEKALQTIEKDIKTQHDTIDALRFDTAQKDFTIDSVFQALYTVSLFYDMKYVVCFYRDKERKKISETQLLELVRAHGPQVHLVLVMDKKPLAKTAIRKVIDATARVTAVKALTKVEANQTAQAVIKASPVQLDAKTTSLLIERVGTDITRLNQELQKLEVLERTITPLDIQRLVSKSSESNIFDLSNALIGKDLDTSFQIYQELLALKMDPLAIIGMIASQLRTSFQYQTLREKGYSEAGMAERLGVSKGQLYYLSKRSMGSSMQLIRLLNRLATLEQDAKLGLVDRFVAFELFMIDITRS